MLHYISNEQLENNLSVVMVFSSCCDRIPTSWFDMYNWIYIAGIHLCILNDDKSFELFICVT